MAEQCAQHYLWAKIKINIIHIRGPSPVSGRATVLVMLTLAGFSPTALAYAWGVFACVSTPKSSLKRRLSGSFLQWLLVGVEVGAGTMEQE